MVMFKTKLTNGQQHRNLFFENINMIHHSIVNIPYDANKNPKLCADKIFCPGTN